MILSKVISTAIKNLYRRVKIKGYGLSDIKTPYESSPFGTDANPIAGMDAVYSETSDNGKQVIVGYINKNRLAGSGEHRLYSTDSDGNVKISIWLKADGTCEIGGSANHLTRFEALESAFNQLKADHNAFLTHVHGGSGTPPTPPESPSTADISGAKIDELKTS